MSERSTGNATVVIDEVERRHLAVLKLAAARDALTDMLSGSSPLTSAVADAVGLMVLRAGAHLALADHLEVLTAEGVA